MYRTDFDTVIFSDLHLGAELSRAHDALQLLKSLSFRRLILLGDIFSDLNFRRLKKHHWHFLSYIRKISNPKRHIEVIWVEGNHDRGLGQLMSHLVGVPVYQQYRWEYAGMRHLAIHGHQFDAFSKSNGALCQLGEWVFLQLQKIDLEDKFASRLLDRLNTRWLRLQGKVQRGALNYARQQDVHRIFCGHTHSSAHAEVDGVHYYNTGSWVDSPCTFVGIHSQGADIYEIELGTDNNNSSQKRTPVITAPAGVHYPSGLPPLVAHPGVCC